MYPTREVLKRGKVLENQIKRDFRVHDIASQKNPYALHHYRNRLGKQTVTCILKWASLNRYKQQNSLKSDTNCSTLAAGNQILLSLERNNQFPDEDLGINWQRYVDEYVLSRN